MIEFCGTLYYIDIDALDTTISQYIGKPSDKIVETVTRTVLSDKGKIISTETIETIKDRGKEIDGAKYDILRMCIEVLVDYDEETDDSLGVDRAFSKTPLSYKLAFNTLYNCGILKEKE